MCKYDIMEKEISTLTEQILQKIRGFIWLQFGMLLMKS